MPRAITTAIPLPAGSDPVTAFRDDPATWLPDARPQGGHRWLFTLTALGFERPVLAEVSNPLTTRSGICRRLSWEAVTLEGDIVEGHRWLPGFRGELRIVGGSSTPSLVLAGELLPPLGVVGGALDAVVLGGVADRSLDALLRAVSDALLHRTPEEVTAAAPTS